MQFLFLWVTFICFSQEKDKPVYFFDVNGEIISQLLFNKKKAFNEGEPTYLSLYFENDTSFIAKLHPRKKYGRLSEKDYLNLKNYLKTKKKTNKDYTLIQYHPGRDRCNGGRSYHLGNSRYGIYSRWYLKKLINEYNYDIHWFHKKDSTMKFRSRGPIKWKVDDKDFMKNLFFPYHFPCNSFVVISNNTKNYIAVYGESGGMTVMDVANEMKQVDNFKD